MFLSRTPHLGKHLLPLERGISGCRSFKPSWCDRCSHSACGDGRFGCCRCRWYGSIELVCVYPFDLEQAAQPTSMPFALIQPMRRLQWAQTGEVPKVYITHPPNIELGGYKNWASYSQGNLLLVPSPSVVDDFAHH